MRKSRKLAALTTAAVGAAGVRALVRVSRRARVRHAAEGIADSIQPSVASETRAVTPAPVADEVHAPGHAHRQWSAVVRDEPAPPPVHERPFAKHRRGLRQPGRG